MNAYAAFTKGYLIIQVTDQMYGLIDFLTVASKQFYAVYLLNQ